MRQFNATPWTGSRRGLLLRALALGIGAFALGGCKQPPPPPPPPPAEPDVELHPVFTQGEFDEILYGMTYPQVVDVLGAESSRQESTYHKGDSEYVHPSLTAWYYWDNEDGSYIKLGFVEKKLTDKESENLPP